MAQFAILSGKALKTAIAGRGAQIATFTQREHQLAVSALAHLGENNDPIYVQAIYDMSPSNYRTGLRLWFCEFGKCTFKVAENGKGGTFVLAKKRETNLDGAMKVAPANFAKEVNAATTPAKDFSASEYLAKVVEKLTKENADPRVIRAVEGAMKVAAGPIVVVRNQKALPTAAQKKVTAKASPKKSDLDKTPAANSVAA